MVRSPKSIGGIFGLALGNAPYGDCDRTENFPLAQRSNAT